tara:strand:+ start:536 stop:811 length:276 start_codon:yes stop_codon:yes gene_type:complete
MYYFIFFILFIIVGLAILEFIFWSFEKVFNYLEEYFFPTPELPDEILDAIEREAHDFVWNMHRVGDGPKMGEYYRVLNYFYRKKYAKYFSL